MLYVLGASVGGTTQRPDEREGHKQGGTTVGSAESCHRTQEEGGIHSYKNISFKTGEYSILKG